MAPGARGRSGRETCRPGSLRASQAPGADLASRRICLVLLSGIGDVVHGLALADLLKRDDPARHLTWVAEPAPAQVLTPHPDVDRVVVYHKGRGTAGLRELWRALREPEFDLAVNAMRYLKGLPATLFSGAPVRLGLDRERARDGVWLFSNRRLPVRGWRHTQDVFLEFAEFLGIEADRDALRWRIPITDAERREQERFFEELPDGPVVSLALASANPKKDWPAERSAELADRIARERGATVLLVGGPSERERELARRVQAVTDSRPVDALSRTVRRLIWILDGSDLAVSPDTGPLHLAHALEVPVVGLFGHTSPWRVGPYRRYHDLIVDRYTDPDEDPDPSSIEPRHGRMERIAVDDVMDRVDRAFDRYVDAGTGR